MNVDSVSSEEYFDKLIDCGALFAWFFHYMPVGNDASPELLLTPDQREEMYHAIRKFRSTKAIFTLDFQNDAEFVQVEDIICILMQMVMWSLVYSSIIQTAISKILLFWTH